jgi:7-carboxy-7-deazaguanine synthase
MAATLLVNEIYLSLQGESTFAGLPCIFIRLTGCPLRCSYCDSAYAFSGGRKLAVAEVLAECDRLAKPYGVPKDLDLAGRLPLVELTGGEPLAQKLSLPLMVSLCERGYTVLLETSGALDIAGVDPRVRRIVDLKCPASGEVARNRWENLPQLKVTDEVKFVISSEEDYAWAKAQVQEHRLAERCPVLFSWAHPLESDQRDKSLKRVPTGSVPITRLGLVERIIADALPVRFQVQMHKVIWPPDERGV